MYIYVIANDSSLAVCLIDCFILRIRVSMISISLISWNVTNVGCMRIAFTRMYLDRHSHCIYFKKQAFFNAVAVFAILRNASRQGFPARRFCACCAYEYFFCFFSLYFSFVLFFLYSICISNINSASSLCCVNTNFIKG